MAEENLFSKDKRIFLNPIRMMKSFLNCKNNYNYLEL